MAIRKDNYVVGAGSLVKGGIMGIDGVVLTEYTVKNAYITPLSWAVRKRGSGGPVFVTVLSSLYEVDDAGERYQFMHMPLFTFEFKEEEDTDMYAQLYTAMKSQMWAKDMEDC